MCALGTQSTEVTKLLILSALTAQRRQSGGQHPPPRALHGAVITMVKERRKNINHFFCYFMWRIQCGKRIFFALQHSSWSVILVVVVVMRCWISPNEPRLLLFIPTRIESHVGRQMFECA